MEAPLRVEERLLTAEEFYDLYAGQDFELVRGKVVDAGSGQPISEWYTRTAEAFGLPVAGEAMTGPITRIVGVPFERAAGRLPSSSFCG